MVRKFTEANKEKRCIQGGIGEADIYKIITTNEELNNKGRLFNRMSLKPGDSFGDHPHIGETEVFYVISGEGEYHDNGTNIMVKAGDTMICKEGEVHGLVNTGKEDLVLIALILFV